MKSGTGKIEWADGDVYEGQWKEDKMHGTGNFTTKGGGRYAGKYHKGKFLKRIKDTKLPTGPAAITTGKAPYGLYPDAN